MHRLLLSILLALSLVGSPAPAAAHSLPDCTMANMAGMAHKPVKPSKMDCCTPGCFFAAAALLPAQPSGDAPAMVLAGPRWPLATAGLSSVNPSALDPPPRPRAHLG